MLFALAPWTLVSIADALKEDGYSEGTVGPIQTFYFRSEEGAWTPERLAGLAGVDVVIRLSVALAGRGIYPTVDPLTSRSRLIESGCLDGEHLALAARIRTALRALLAPDASTPAAEPLALERAEKLLRFFAQPFYVAEPYTKRSGVTVGLAESLRVCREILDGVHDAVPTKAFYFTGGLDAVLDERGRPIVMACLWCRRGGTIAAPMARHWLGSISAGPSPTSPSSTRRRASWSAPKVPSTPTSSRQPFAPASSASPTSTASTSARSAPSSTAPRSP